MRTWLSSWTVACLLLLSGLLPALAAADGPRREGVATCASTTCHGRASPAPEGRIQANEYVTWSSFDPHARAFATLRSERSRVMARRLGLATAAHEAPECLDCHADVVPAAARGPRYQVDDGIGCEACHGSATDWLPSHHDQPRVRHADNLARGMTALEQPAVRAGVCVRCHVGDDGDRFASHRLMAAGHPRLGFELETFTELWRTSGGREHYRVDADYRERKGSVPPTATWATGLVAASAQSLAVIRARYGQGPLPDFALFNCYSCHRSMGLDRWERRTSPAGEPGRLRFDDSVLRTLAAALAARPDLARPVEEAAAGLQAAAQSGPGAVTAAVTRAETAVATAGRNLAARPLDPAESRQALEALVRRARAGDFPDYVHAEQLAMGLVILSEASGKPRGPELEELFQALEDDDRFDAGRFRRVVGKSDR